MILYDFLAQISTKIMIIELLFINFVVFRTDFDGILSELQKKLRIFYQAVITESACARSCLFFSSPKTQPDASGGYATRSLTGV